jgi:hypothetical protein
MPPPTWFDESRLDDESTLTMADPSLRQLAESGARVRREAGEAQWALSEAVALAREQARPRAVVAAGPDSRLLRAALEPWCPVPFVAWPNPGLPGWAGGLDLVVVLAPDGGDVGTASAVSEAVRRGCQVVVAAPPHSLVAEHAAGRWSTILPTTARDQLATAVLVLEYLDRVDLGPSADHEQVAEALDRVAMSCSPHRDIAVNPAKILAIALADANPVVWGGSVLAPGARPHGDRRRRRAPAAGHREGGPPQRVRRPVQRRAGRPPTRPRRARRRGRRPAGPRAARPAPGGGRRARRSHRDGRRGRHLGGRAVRLAPAERPVRGGVPGDRAGQRLTVCY